MVIKIKRVYEPVAKDDGFRILIDRLWPRGLAKEKAHIDLWLKEIAPSNYLREWFAHDSIKWPEFKKRYFEELKNKNEQIEVILDRAKSGNVTLVYSAREKHYNDAVALKEFLEKRM